LQPDQAGICDPKQAVKKKMKKKRTHRPTQVIPARRLQAERYQQGEEGTTKYKLETK